MMYGAMSYVEFEENVLMIEKVVRSGDPNSGYFTLPGGKLSDSEKSSLIGRLDCSVRETSEEGGVKLIEPFLKGVVLFDNSERVFDNWENPQDFQVYIFGAKGFVLEECDKVSDEGRAVWVPKKEIIYKPMSVGDSKLYEWLDDGRNFSGVIKHKGKLLDERNTFVDYFN
jgi:8-oxo-dGTP pyrophosphatase MutT (NUDIX family)